MFRYLQHPYRLLQIKIFSFIIFRFLLLWGSVMGVYHGTYFIINLSERLPIEMERGFLYLYILWGLLGISLLIRQGYRVAKNFPHFLERNFDLGFRWFNALDQFQQPKKVPGKIAGEVFAEIDRGFLWKKLIRPYQSLLLAGLMGWLSYPLLALAFPVQQVRFLDNLWTIWNYQEPYLDLEYPEYVLQNDTYRLTYRGDYREAVFKEGSREWRLRSGDTLTLTNLMNSFYLEYRLEKGRIVNTGSLPVRVIPPPQVTSHVFTIHSPHQKPYTLEGVYNLIADYNSRTRLLLNYQEDQELTDYEILPLKPGTEITSPPIPEAQFEKPHQLRLGLQLNRELELGVRVQNRYGQWSEKTVFTLTIRKNHPPTVLITEPDPLIHLDRPDNIQIDFVAKDDVSLREVSLRYRIVTGQGKRTSLSLTSTPENNTSLWVSNFSLPLHNLNAPPGSTVIYYLQARDLEGGTGYSSTNQIRVNSSRETYTQSLEGGEQLREGLNDRREDFNSLERDYEKLKILSETKQLDSQDIKNFQENVKEFSDKVQQDIENVQKLEKDNYENKQIISENFRDKLLELKKSLENLDKDYLQKMNQRFQTILNNVNENIKPEEVNNFLQTLDLKEMENRVEQTLLYLENLKKMQKIDALEKLSQNLYLRYKDLESYIIADLITPEQIRQESSSIKEGLDFIRKEFAEVSPGLPPDPRMKTIKKNIESELTPEKISAFDKLSERYRDDGFLNQRSENLDQLRRNLARLNSQNQDFNQAQLLAALNAQILSLNQKVEWLEKLDDGKIFDLTALEDEKKLELATQFLSKHKTLLFNFREQLFLLSSAATLELDFMQHYDKAIEKLGEIQRTISPDQQRPDNPNRPQLEKNFNTVKQTTLTLSRELILLKSILSKMRDTQQQNMGLNRAMEMQRNLNQRLQEMMQRGNLSEREKQYLKKMALEQSLLRSLMEGVERGSQQPQEGQGQSGQSGQGEPQPQGADGQGENGTGSSGDGNAPGEEGEGQEGRGKTPGNGDQNNSEEPANQRDSEDDSSPKSEAAKKRREIIDKMKELERELLKDNPDLARIQDLQQTIEENLFKNTRGLQDKEERENNERLAERENNSYQENLPTDIVKEEIKKTDRSSLDQLRERQLSTPPDFQGRIRRFIQLNSIR